MLLKASFHTCIGKNENFSRINFSVVWKILVPVRFVHNYLATILQPERMKEKYMKKIIQIVKDNKKWILALICIIIFLDVLEDVLDNQILNFDNIVYSKIIYFKSDVITNLLKIITFFGSAIAFISICILSFIFMKNKKIPTYISINLAICGIFNFILKNVVRRNRPIGYRLVEESGFSFPSGHSMASMAFYGLIIYFIFKFVKNKKIKTCLIIVLSMLITLIGISRIYLGVHYPSDVLAGFMISISYLILYTHIIKNNIN